MTPTPEQVAAWAREAGASMSQSYGVFVLESSQLQRFAALAGAAQAEAVGEVKQKKGHADGEFFVLWRKQVRPGDLLYTEPQPAQPVAVPYFNRREVEFAIHCAENPTGMCLNDGKERVILPGGTLRRMLQIIDILAAATTPPTATQPVLEPPDHFPEVRNMVPLGCTRSHPHQDMDEACQIKSEIARLQNKLNGITPPAEGGVR